MTRWLVRTTDFGDLALLAPLAVAILIWLRYFSRVAAWVDPCAEHLRWPHRIIEDRLLWMSARW